MLFEKLRKCMKFTLMINVKCFSFYFLDFMYVNF